MKMQNHPILNYIPPIKSIQLQKEEIKVDHCPLCSSQNYQITQNIDIDNLIDSWIKERNFNPISDVYRHKTLEQRRCNICGLYYYNYLLIDTPELYELLSQKNYYPKNRPEYEIGIDIIKDLKPSSLIELGCGCGNFLSKISAFVKSHIGIESNKRALTLCQEKKVNATNTLSKKQKFDVVCHFELLEHVTNIDEFIKDNISLLDKNGLIIMGTPNPESILNFTCTTILDLPPHHKYMFSKQTLDWLAKKYQLDITHYQTTSVDNFRYEIYQQSTNSSESIQMIRQKYVGDTHVIAFQKK